ncbi:MAG: DUF637 domain-containing protein, partial [Alphaproteobacteria bacterium]
LPLSPQLHINPVGEIHEHWEQSTSGLTPGFAAVLALAVTIATGGAGGPAAQAATAMGFGAEGAAFLAAKAGVQAVASATVVGTVNHQGNVFKAVEDLGKPTALKSIATAIATAGLVGPAPEGGIFSANFAENLATHGAQHLSYGLKAGAISFAINGGSAKDALKGAGLLAVASAVQASVANELGVLRKAGLDSVTHKLGHALAGAAAGAILDPKNPGKGAAAGALGAVIGETVAESLPEHLTRETRADYGKIAAATGALLSKQDVPTAIVTADTALQNNFLLSAGELAYEWLEEKNPEKAAELKEISLNILSHVTGESRELLEAALPGIMLANNYLGGGLVKKIAKTTLKKQIKSAAKDALKPNLKVIGKGNNNPKNLKNKYNLQKQLARACPQLR